MGTFNKGDVVQLKSGGPKMTVSDLGDYSESAGPENGVTCIWFDEAKKVVHRVFDDAVLELYSPDSRR